MKRLNSFAPWQGLLDPQANLAEMLSQMVNLRQTGDTGIRKCSYPTFATPMVAHDGNKYINHSHLHCPSRYSLLDGASSIDRLVHRASELGMNSLAALLTLKPARRAGFTARQRMLA